MIKVDSVISHLNKAKGPETFDQIFKAVYDDLPKTYESDSALKADLLNALIGSIEIVRIEGDKFDLAKKYTYNELKRIKKLDSETEKIEK